MKMKRVLIQVEPTIGGGRYGGNMDDAVNEILAYGLFADMHSYGGADQRIVWRANFTIAARCKSANWLPEEYGNCPPEFVLELPAYLVRKSVPTYTGPIKGETK